jgi:hypothetical protein
MIGEAKQRRRRAALGANVSLIDDPREAYETAHRQCSFDYYGVQSRFFRKGDKYFVESDGPDGKLTQFEIKYTFGIDPLKISGISLTL